MTLEQLWDWAVDLGRSSKPQSPLALHSRSGDRDGWEWDEDAQPQDAIRGLPFSRPFAKFVDRELPRSLKAALEAVKPANQCSICRGPDEHRRHRQGQHAMFSVCKAVVRDGVTDREACRQRLGLSEFAFQVSATNGLLALKSALEHA